MPSAIILAQINQNLMTLSHIFSFSEQSLENFTGTKLVND